MKLLMAILLCSFTAHASESFIEGASRIAVDFARQRDSEEAVGVRHANQMAQVIEDMIRSGEIEAPPPDVVVHLGNVSLREYFGVATRTYSPNSAWTEMRDEVEDYFRKSSRHTHIAWFEPLHISAGEGSMTVYYPYVVKTDLPQTLLPAGAKPLKELLILAIARPHGEGTQWELLSDFGDEDLTYWQHMIRPDQERKITGYDGGALLIARYGGASPYESEWRLLEAYEHGKAVVSKPAFRELKAGDPGPGAKILPFPRRCEDGVKK